MIKTNPYSRFALYTLDQIRDSREVILQAEKTGSSFSKENKECYLCEVVSCLKYPTDTIDSLVAENIKLSAENRKLRSKIQKLEEQK